MNKVATADNYGIMIVSRDKTLVDRNQQKFNLALDKWRLLLYDSFTTGW